MIGLQAPTLTIDLQLLRFRASTAKQHGGHWMSINKQSEISANLQIGPTDLGMVRLYLETPDIQLPLDFDPDEADEIAEELRIAAVKARGIALR